MKYEYQTLDNGSLVEIQQMAGMPDDYMLIVDGDIITFGKYADIIWVLNTIQESIA